MSDGMGREFTYLSSHATNRYFIPNWGKYCITNCIKTAKYLLTCDFIVNFAAFSGMRGFTKSLILF